MPATQLALPLRLEAHARFATYASGANVAAALRVARRVRQRIGDVREEPGSFNWTRPQQAATPATDIYQLGALAYFLLSGQRPYGEAPDPAMVSAWRPERQRSTTDAEGRVTMFNQAAADLAGRDPTLGCRAWLV